MYDTKKEKKAKNNENKQIINGTECIIQQQESHNSLPIQHHNFWKQNLQPNS